jgi:tRNA pseudouridine38-40 synthase
MGLHDSPHLRTVEGELQKNLREIGYSGRIQVASRTDKGVSALSNVIRIDYEQKDICRILTSLLDHIWVYGYYEGDHNPRHCRKQYSYCYHGSFDSQQLDRVCSLVSGIHDFSTLSRGVHRVTRKEIEVTYEIRNPLIVFHFSGNSFLWEMIRRCMAAMLSLLSGTISEDFFLQILSGDVYVNIPPAPAENLLLVELVYPFSFTIDRYAHKKMACAFLHHYENHLVQTHKFEEMLLNLQKREGKE